MFAPGRRTLHQSDASAGWRLASIAERSVIGPERSLEYGWPGCAAADCGYRDSHPDTRFWHRAVWRAYVGMVTNWLLQSVRPRYRKSADTAGRRTHRQERARCCSWAYLDGVTHDAWPRCDSRPC